MSPKQTIARDHNEEEIFPESARIASPELNSNCEGLETEEIDPIKALPSSSSLQIPNTAGKESLLIEEVIGNNPGNMLCGELKLIKGEEKTDKTDQILEKVALC